MLLETHKTRLMRRASTLLAVTAGALAGVGFTAAHRAQLAEAAPPAVAGPARAVVSPPAGVKPLASLVTGAHAQPRPTGPASAARATVSLYEHTAAPSVLRRQGCTAAKRGVGGIVILDFGQPAYNGHTYGTNLFSGRFAGNAEITSGLLAYARGYAYCVDPSSGLTIS